MRVMLLSLLVLAAVGSSAAAQQRFQFVRGVVRDSAGRPISEADVQLAQRRTTTNAQGIFRVDSLRPGRYPITIRRVGYAAVRSQVAVTASEPTEVEYFLGPVPVLLPTLMVTSGRTGIYGTVGDTAYRPAMGARVEVLNHGEVLTDSMGRFAFPTLEKGSFMVRVTFRGYSERRVLVDVKKGEGKELALFLTPYSGPPVLDDPGVLVDLGKRLAFGISRELLKPADLERYGSGGICDIPRIKSELGSMSSATTTLILNGSTAIPQFAVGSLCNWRADEVELVEFSSDICRDVTNTIGQLLSPPVWCSGRTRNVTRSLVSGGSRVRTQRAGSSYIILWEKK